MRNMTYSIAQIYNIEPPGDKIVNYTTKELIEKL